MTGIEWVLCFAFLGCFYLSYWRCPGLMAALLPVSGTHEYNVFEIMFNTCRWHSSYVNEIMFKSIGDR